MDRSKSGSLVVRAILAIVLMIGFYLFANSSIISANSAEPPSILIIVPQAPTDLEITLGSQNVQVSARRIDKNLESYYTFYSRDVKSSDYLLNVSTGGKTFQIALDNSLKTYNNVFTLDLQDQTLTSGKSVSRSVTLISLRIILTLLIEAVVFYLFGFRKKKSWLIFLAVNLLTQLLLNLAINASYSPLDSYNIFSLFSAEILVFLVELIVFLTLTKEHTRLRTGSYVAVANLMSLVLGGYLIMVLPV